MKLRRVLSIIYLNAYQVRDPFHLIRGEQVQPHIGDLEHMRELSENEFFHIEFSDYAKLNRRRVNGPRDILSILDNSDSFEAFRDGMLNNPVQDEEDAIFISSLVRIMDPLEKMRNCVAHNRRPPKDLTDHYPNARRQLDELLTQYLTRWQVSE